MRVLIEWAGRKGCAHMLCGCFSKKMAVDEFVAQPKEEESLSASSGEEEDDDDESSSTESEERRRDAALQRRALGHLGHQSLALPWRSWQEAARRRALMARTLAHLRHREMTRGWQAWLAHVEEAATHLERLKRATSRLRNGELNKGLGSWVAAVADRAARVAVLRVGVSRLRCRDLHRCWQSWLQFNAVVHIQQRVLAHAFHRELVLGLRTWTTFAANQSLRSESLINLMHRQAALVWRSWADWVQTRREWLTLIDRAKALMWQRGRRRALTSWHEFLRALSLARRVVGSGRSAEIARGFRAWVAVLVAREQALEILDNARGHFSRRRLVHSLTLWRDVGAATLRKCLLHLRSRVLSLGWRTWQQMASARAAFMAYLRRGFGWMSNRRLAAAWAAWCASCELWGRLDTVGTVAVHRMLKLERRRAWASWMERCREFELLSRALGSARNRLLSLAIVQWIAVSNELDAWWERRERVRGHMVRRGLVRGLGAWRDFLSFLRAARHLKNRRLSQAWRLWTLVASARAAALARIRRAGSAIANAELNLGWISWRAFCDAASAKAEKMLSAIRRFRNREVLKGWATWSAMAADGRTMRSCIMRALHRALAAGWSSWKQTVVERLATLHSMRKGAGRMLNRRVASAFAAWLDALTAQRRSMGLRRLLQLELSRGFNSWSLIVADRVAFRKRMEQLMPEAAPQKGGLLGWLVPQKPILQGALASLRYRELRRGWLGWRELCQRRHAKLNRLRRAVTRMIHRQVLKGWRSWRKLVHQLLVMRRAIGRGRNQSLSRGLGAWLRSLARQEGSARRHERVRGHMVRRGLVRGLGAWRDFLSFLRAARHLKNRQLSLAWRSWALQAAHARSILIRIEAPASRMLQRKAAQAFVSWLDGMEYFAERAAALQRSMTYMLNRELSRGWASWCWGCQMHKANREKMQKCLVRALSNSVSRGLMGWVDMAARRAALLQTLRKGVGYMLYRRLATNLAQWRRALTPLREVETVTLRLVALAADHLVLSSCARAFITWQDAYALLWHSRWLAVYPPNEPRRPTRNAMPLWAERLFDRAEERARARSGRVRPRKEPRKPSLKLAEPEVRPPKRKSVVTRLLLPPRRGAPIIRV